MTREEELLENKSAALTAAADSETKEDPGPQLTEQPSHLSRNLVLGETQINGEKTGSSASATLAT